MSTTFNALNVQKLKVFQFFVQCCDSSVADVLKPVKFQMLHIWEHFSQALHSKILLNLSVRQLEHKDVWQPVKL